jgi:hypothetical protein
VDFFHPHPTPRQLFREFESGRISREELQEQMGEHARHIIEELEEHHRNPIAMMLEQMRNRRAVAKLTRRYDEAAIREVLLALADQVDFPPSNLLWNADHRDVPLYCFIRMKHEPVFRILGLDIHPLAAAVRIEYGSAKPKLATRESITLRRNPQGELRVDQRKVTS